MCKETQSFPLPHVEVAAELPEFEDLARRAIGLGFTVHLTHYRYHPAHTAKYPDLCQSHVQLSIIPILDEPTMCLARQNQECKGRSIVDVLEQARSFLDRYESCENLAQQSPRRRGRPPKQKPIEFPGV